MQKPQTILCTVGTSLFYPNLIKLPKEDEYDTWLDNQLASDRPILTLEFVQRLKQHFLQEQWEKVAQDLTHLSGSNRLCGAEVNSIHDLIQKDYCQPCLHIVLCHSATDAGRQIAEILKVYFRRNGQQHSTETREIEGLIDSDPKIFRTQGLRNLVKTLGRVYKAATTPVAINATGGFKAQTAIAVLVGQALGLPVYYKHERFSEIIPFPPMPIDLDLNLWLNQFHWFHMFSTHNELNWDELKHDALTEHWDERMETLVEKEEIGGQTLIALSPMGQIVHERFMLEYAPKLEALLPLASESKVEAHLSSYEELTLAPVQKKNATLPQHGWKKARSPIKKHMQQIVDEVPYVKTCRTFYWNPALGQPIHFRQSQNHIEGIFSNGTWTVKFYVITAASTDQERRCAVVDLNQRFAE